jgi:hypothetical protein
VSRIYLIFLEILLLVFLYLLNPLNAELNPICHLLALLGSQHILHVSRIGVNLCTIFCEPVTNILVGGSHGGSAEDSKLGRS